MRILDHVDIRQDDQPLLHHLIENRKERSQLLLRVDHGEQDRCIVRQVQSGILVNATVRAIAKDSPVNRDTGDLVCAQRLHPQIAPESAGDLFDGTEIDEILSLRIMTLTDKEKQEIRNSDERARQILERTETMPAEQFMKLHGAM